MAKRGVEYCVAAEATYNTGTGMWSYGNGRSLGPVAKFNFSPTKATGKDFGDNRTVETESETRGGTLSVELNNDTYENKAFLLGHTVSEDTITTPAGPITATGIHYNVDDEAPFVGIGAVVHSTGDQNYKNWIVKFYPLVKFSEPTDENATKTENITFGHYLIEGDVTEKDGLMKKNEAFSTKAEAKEYLNALLHIS